MISGRVEASSLEEVGDLAAPVPRSSVDDPGDWTGPVLCPVVGLVASFLLTIGDSASEGTGA